MLAQSSVDALRDVKVGPQSLFIDGRWTPARTETVIPTISPIDGRQITTLAAASADDVDAAVGAARRAYESGVWSRMPAAGRKKVLYAIADRIEASQLELAVLGARDNGTELRMALKSEPGSAAQTFRYYAEALDKVYGEIAPTASDVLGLIHREAVGVVGAIVPWNMPLMIGAWKIAPALALGNSVVLKPAELASLTLLRLAEICAEAGLPNGVFNVVTGSGASTGKALAEHMDVDVLAFTGSDAVGRKLLEYAARSNLKRVYLELGGKSPNIVFADAPDLERAAQVSANGIFRNSGQVCVAGSRLLVQRSVHQEMVDRLVGATEKLKVGNPLDLDSDIGAVASAEQLAKDFAYATQAVDEGAQKVTGGDRVLAETGGYYMRPTIFDQVRPEMTLAREEVFGPLLAVIPFDAEDEAVAIANGTRYGLASAVWTSDLSRAHRLVRAINAGVVHVNTYGGSDNTVPLGGHRQSGNGSDKSLHAFDKFSVLKTAWIQL